MLEGGQAKGLDRKHVSVLDAIGRELFQHVATTPDPTSRLGHIAPGEMDVDHPKAAPYGPGQVTLDHEPLVGAGQDIQGDIHVAQEVGGHRPIDEILRIQLPGAVGDGERLFGFVPCLARNGSSPPGNCVRNFVASGHG